MDNQCDKWMNVLKSSLSLSDAMHARSGWENLVCFSSQSYPRLRREKKRERGKNAGKCWCHHFLTWSGKTRWLFRTTRLLADETTRIIAKNKRADQHSVWSTRLAARSSPLFCAPIPLRFVGRSNESFLEKDFSSLECTFTHRSIQDFVLTALVRTTPSCLNLIKRRRLSDRQKLTKSLADSLFSGERNVASFLSALAHHRSHLAASKIHGEEQAVDLAEEWQLTWMMTRNDRFSLTRHQENHVRRLGNRKRMCEPCVSLSLSLIYLALQSLSVFPSSSASAS